MILLLISIIINIEFASAAEAFTNKFSNWEFALVTEAPFTNNNDHVFLKLTWGSISYFCNSSADSASNHTNKIDTDEFDLFMNDTNLYWYDCNSGYHYDTYNTSGSIYNTHNTYNTNNTKCDYSNYVYSDYANYSLDIANINSTVNINIIYIRVYFFDGNSHEFVMDEQVNDCRKWESYDNVIAGQHWYECNNNLIIHSSYQSIRISFDLENAPYTNITTSAAIHMQSQCDTNIILGLDFKSVRVGIMRNSGYTN